MAVAFPAIRAATGRTMQPGAYPVRRSTAPTASVTSTVRGDRVTEVKLVLDYGYIEDEQAALIWATWHATMGGFREVTLPGNAFHGVDPSVVAKIPPYLGWYMDGAPEISSVQPGLSRIRVGFAGRLAGTGGAITVAPDPNPLAAPCAGEGGMFFIEAPLASNHDMLEWTVDADGACHIHSRRLVGTDPFTGYCYDPNNITSSASRYRVSYSEDGWVPGWTALNTTGRYVFHPTEGLLFFYIAFDGPAGSTTKQRLYKLQINTANGAVVSTTAWDRDLVTALDGFGTSTGFFGVEEVVIDSDGSMYVVMHVSRLASQNSWLTIVKFNSSNAQVWSARLGAFTRHIKLLVGASELVFCCIGSLEVVMRISKTDGSLIGTRANYTGVGGLSLNINDAAIDDDGNIYLSHERQSTGNDYVVTKLNSDLTIAWAKVVPTRGAMPSGETPAIFRGIDWDAPRNRLLVLGDYTDGGQVTGSDNRRPAIVAISPSGEAIKSWGLVNRGFFTSPQYRTKIASTYGGNLLGRGSSQSIMCFQRSLGYEGTANVYNISNALQGTGAQLGELPTPVASNHAVTRATPTAPSLSPDPGNPFILSSGSVTAQSLAATAVNRRFFVPPP
jgi:hypothetical protein